MGGQVDDGEPVERQCRHLSFLQPERVAQCYRLADTGAIVARGRRIRSAASARSRRSDQNGNLSLRGQLGSTPLPSIPAVRGTAIEPPNR
jgi:hypothetical protein